MIGQTVSHYKILEKLGEGGMGVVYKAHDTKLDRDVALKFLPPYLAAEPGQKERFFQEARAASALNHPNITTIHEIDEHYEQIFIAMELVEGKTLKELIKAELLPIKKVLDIAIQVCDGLTAAAEKQVVHRDIKSDNILVTPKMQVKIMDFGLAKLKGTTKLTQTGSTIGTAAYMSPEQASGEEVDHRSDIFSFGVVLYELLTGHLPFRGEHPSGYIYSILNEDPPPLARFNDKVSMELQRIVSKALAKDREERYQHIDELGADLRRERKNLEYAKSTTLPKAEAVHKPKKPLLKILVPTTAVLVIALLYFLFNPFKVEVSRQQTAAASPNALAVMYFENIPDPEDKDHTGEMLTNLLTTALFQTRDLEVVSRERLYDIQGELGQGASKAISPSIATKIAQRAGVSMMLLGSILQQHPSLTVTFRLIDVKSGKLLSTQRLAGFSNEQMFPMVDSLAVLVRTGLNVATPAAAETKSVVEVTTSSPEAYRSYLEGVELANKFYYSEAKAAIERAIELDSNFAMAYFKLANINGSLGDAIGQTKALEKAWRLRKNAAERERLQIEAVYAIRIEQNPSKSAEVWEELLRKYPHEQNGYMQLGQLYMTSLNDYAKARQTFLAGLKTDSLDKNLWNILAYLHASFGYKEEALQAVGRYLKLAPGEPNPYDSKGDIHAAIGELDSAVFWYQKAFSFRSDFHSVEKLGRIAAWRQDYAAAEKYFRQYSASSNPFEKAYAEADLISILIDRGQLKQAEKEMENILLAHQSQKLRNSVINDCAALIDLSDETGDRPALLGYAKVAAVEARKDPSDRIAGRDFLARAWLINGDAKKAHQLVDELKKETTNQSPAPQQRKVENILARLAYEEGKYELATGHFEKGIKFIYTNRPRSIIYGVSLLKTGRLEAAIDELESVSQWTYVYWGPFYSIKVHYWLGVAYEQKGDKVKAIQEYEKFLEIWKEADFNSPELADAKVRLSKLKQTAAK